MVRRRPDVPNSRWSDPPLLSVTCQRCGRKTALWAGETEICDPCVTRDMADSPSNKMTATERQIRAQGHWSNSESRQNTAYGKFQKRAKSIKGNSDAD